MVINVTCMCVGTTLGYYTRGANYTRDNVYTSLTPQSITAVLTSLGLNQC